VRTKFFFQASDEFRNGYALFCEHLQQEQTGRDAVALWNVPGEAYAAAFLGSQQDASLNHFRGNVLESHTGFGHFQPIGGGHFIHHGSGGEGLDDTSPALAIDKKMPEEEANQLMSRKRVAATVHATDSVSIAVSHETDIVRMFAKKGRAASI